MTTDEISQKLMELEDNERLTFKLGKREYRIARMGNWTQRQINKKLTKLRLKKLNTASDILDSDDDRKIIPQVVAIAILKSKIKVRLFYWTLWRKLDRKYGQEDFFPIIDMLINNSDLGFFSKNLASLHAAVTMEAMMTKETITSITARRKSEQETTSSSNSTEQSPHTPAGSTGTGTQS